MLGFGLHSTLSLLAGEGDSAERSGVKGRLGEAEAEAGMAEMTEKFREGAAKST